MLRICLGAEYPGIIDDCIGAPVLSMPRCRRRVAPLAGIRAVHVQVNGKLWLHALPQHGPGPKHERRIVLQDWQRHIVDRYPTSSCAA